MQIPKANKSHLVGEVMSEKENKANDLIQKVSGFGCALKLIGYTVILMMVNSCVDKISEPKLKEQEKFYKEILQQQCKERMGEKTLEAIRELSKSDNPNAVESIKAIETIHQKLLNDCDNLSVKQNIKGNQNAK